MPENLSLPPLPQPFVRSDYRAIPPREPLSLFTAEQMQAYALAERARLMPALLAAKTEIEWWVREHGCCRGQERETMALLEAAIRSQE